MNALAPTVVVVARALPSAYVADLGVGPDLGAVAGLAVGIIEPSWRASITSGASEAFLTHALPRLIITDCGHRSLGIAIAG